MIFEFRGTGARHRERLARARDTAHIDIGGVAPRSALGLAIQRQRGLSPVICR